MSDSDTSGFGKFVPGFDFLQSLAKGASSIPQMPSLGAWVTPTLNEEELEKRIQELKHVHFWLDQNARALLVTIQALEVQKMTVIALKGMNLNLAEMVTASAKVAAASLSKATEATVVATANQPDSAPEPAKEPAQTTGDAPSAAEQAQAGAVPGLIDPIQLWNTLTQQFQHIASAAVKQASTVSHVPAKSRSAAASGSAGAAKSQRPQGAKKSVPKDTAPPASGAARRSPAARKGAAASGTTASMAKAGKPEAHGG